MPDTETVTANGLDFACHRWGDGDRLALCLHGFPDDAGSMAPIGERLADEGFTAVAPYMRGYGPTGDAPDDDYSAAALGSDAVELASTLVDEENLDDPVLVGHDWGAVAAYSADRIDPDRFEKMATMAVPPRFAGHVFSNPRQLLRSWYIWFFQLPFKPEEYLKRRDYALIELLWSTWSPGWDFPDERIESVKETLDTGNTVENALAYYRQFVRPMALDMLRSGLPDPEDEPPIRTESLVLAGADDGCIGPEMFEHAGDAFEADCRVAKIRDAGHFMHQERPDVVGDEIAAFLAD
jgi:pimeloyl-ACP methyl ester carboxylesterase